MTQKLTKQYSSQQGRRGHEGLILNSATSYPNCSVFAALAALLWKSSVLVSRAYLRKDFLGCGSAALCFPV